MFPAVILAAQSLISQSYADGSYQGQCGDFAYNFADVAIDDYSDLTGLQKKLKRADLTKGSAFNPIVVGDVIIQDVGTYDGHEAVINAILKGYDGTIIFELTEANWNLDGKVHNNRLIRADDPTIVGYVGARKKVVKNSYPKGWTVDPVTGHFVMIKSSAPAGWTIGEDGHFVKLPKT